MASPDEQRYAKAAWDAAVQAVQNENTEYRELLRELLVQLCENPSIREDGNAPGHAHEVPGVWDSDNGDLAGKPCAWCAMWARSVANGLVAFPECPCELRGENVQADGSARPLTQPL